MKIRILGGGGTIRLYPIKAVCNPTRAVSKNIKAVINPIKAVSFVKSRICADS
jgi:hypothetical protein